MTRRSWHEPQTVGTEGLPMFDVTAPSPRPTSTQLGIEARDTTAAKHQRDIDRLCPLARELAEKAGDAGITVSNIRLAAVARGLLTGEETGRSLAGLGKVCEAAGLENTGRTRRSSIPKSHGNRHSVHVLPAFGRAPQRATQRNDDAQGAA